MRMALESSVLGDAIPGFIDDEVSGEQEVQA